MTFKIIKYKVRLEPRTKDGGFGHSECTKCGCKTTAYLEFHLYGAFVLLCKGCLDEGIRVVNEVQLESFKNSRRKEE